MSRGPAIEHHGCKCEAKDRILISSSHAAECIFSSTGRVGMLVMVEEIKDKEDVG